MLDVSVAFFGSAGVAVGAFDPANLYIKYAARNLRSLLYLPTPCVATGNEHGSERDRWVDFLGGGVTIS